MREIVIDTETTGLAALDGNHRLVEIGAVELINRSPTGRTFHSYVYPERDIPADAVAAHGIPTDFSGDKPLFTEVADESSLATRRFWWVVEPMFGPTR